MRALALVRSSLAIFTLTLGLAAPAPAQCGTPDGLDPLPGVICGAGPFVWLQQKAFAQQALGICWRDCGVDATAGYTAQWGGLAAIFSGTPAAPVCAWYSTRLMLLQGTAVRWIGSFHVTYSRTWTEVDSSGQALQVWRYLVNGDMSPVGTTPGPCATPACASSFGNLVRFTGYIDYAQTCGTPLFERAWMITHGCDTIDHQAGYPRQGVFHPDRFYTFVGPAAGFVVGAGGTLENGPANFEAVRRWDAIPMPARCNYEERLLFSNFNPNGLLCLCGVGPANWYEAFFNAAGSQGTTITPYPGSDPFRSYPIGMWTNPNVFPAVEELRYNTNDLQYQECTGNPPRQEYYFGVTTVGGNPAFQLTTPPNPLPLTFIDQGNSMILPANVPTRNRPYRTDHVLNLNM